MADNVVRMASVARVKPITGTSYDTVIPSLLRFEEHFRAVMTVLREEKLDANLSQDDINVLMNRDGFAKSYQALTTAMTEILRYNPSPVITPISPSKTVGWNGAFYYAIRKLMITTGPKVVVDFSDSVKGNKMRFGADIVRVKIYTLTGADETLLITDMPDDEQIDLILVNHVFTAMWNSDDLFKMLSRLRLSGYCIGSFMDPTYLRFAAVGMLPEAPDVKLVGIQGDSYTYTVEASTYVQPMINERNVWQHFLDRGFRCVFKTANDYASLLPTQYKFKMRGARYQRVVELSRVAYPTTVDFNYLFDPTRKAKLLKKIFVAVPDIIVPDVQKSHPIPLETEAIWHLLSSSALVTYKTDGVDALVVIENNTATVILRGGGTWRCDVVYQGIKLVVSCDAVSPSGYPGRLRKPKYLYYNDFLSHASPDFVVRATAFMLLQKENPTLDVIHIKNYCTMRDIEGQRMMLDAPNHEGLIIQAYSQGMSREVYSLKKTLTVDVMATGDFAQTVYGSIETLDVGVVEVALERTSEGLKPSKVLRVRSDKSRPDSDDKQFKLAKAMDIKAYFILVSCSEAMPTDPFDIEKCEVIWYLVQSDVHYQYFTVAQDVMKFIMSYTRVLRFPAGTSLLHQNRAYSARSYLYALYVGGTFDKVKASVHEDDVMLAMAEIC
jgi:hypothetical protein